MYAALDGEIEPCPPSDSLVLEATRGAITIEDSPEIGVPVRIITFDCAKVSIRNVTSFSSITVNLRGVSFINIHKVQVLEGCRIRESGVQQRGPGSEIAVSQSTFGELAIRSPTTRLALSSVSALSALNLSNGWRGQNPVNVIVVDHPPKHAIKVSDLKTAGPLKLDHFVSFANTDIVVKGTHMDFYGHLLIPRFSVDGETCFHRSLDISTDGSIAGAFAIGQDARIVADHDVAVGIRPMRSKEAADAARQLLVQSRLGKCDVRYDRWSSDLKLRSTVECRFGQLPRVEGVPVVALRYRPHPNQQVDSTNLGFQFMPQSRKYQTQTASTSRSGRSAVERSAEPEAKPAESIKAHYSCLLTTFMATYVHPIFRLSVHAYGELSLLAQQRPLHDPDTEFCLRTISGETVTSLTETTWQTGTVATLTVPAWFQGDIHVEIQQAATSFQFATREPPNDPRWMVPNATAHSDALEPFLELNAVLITSLGTCQIDVSRTTLKGTLSLMHHAIAGESQHDGHIEHDITLTGGPPPLQGWHEEPPHQNTVRPAIIVDESHIEAYLEIWCGSHEPILVSNSSASSIVVAAEAASVHFENVEIHALVKIATGSGNIDIRQLAVRSRQGLEAFASFHDKMVAVADGRTTELHINEQAMHLETASGSISMRDSPYLGVHVKIVSATGFVSLREVTILARLYVELSHCLNVNLTSVDVMEMCWLRNTGPDHPVVDRAHATVTDCKLGELKIDSRTTNVSVTDTFILSYVYIKTSDGNLRITDVTVSDHIPRDARRPALTAAFPVRIATLATLELNGLVSHQATHITVGTIPHHLPQTLDLGQGCHFARDVVILADGDIWGACAIARNASIHAGQAISIDLHLAESEHDFVQPRSVLIKSSHASCFVQYHGWTAAPCKRNW